MQPRDFIFILIGHEAIELPRHGAGQPFLTGQSGCFSSTDACHKILIAPSITRRLIGFQVIGEARDHLIQSFWPARRFRRLSRGDAAQCKSILVALHRCAIQFDGAQNSLRRKRHQPTLPGKAQHERVEVDRIAQITLNTRKRRNGECFTAGSIQALQHGAVFVARLGILHELRGGRKIRIHNRYAARGAE